MKKTALKPALISILILLSLYSKAQLYFQNNTNEPVYLAICMHYSSKDSKYFGSEGWWKVEPGDKIQVNSGIGLNDNIYYYAYSSVSKKKYEGDINILVHPTNKFFIKNADKEYQKKENPEYVWYKFRHVNMNSKLLQTKYTIELNY